MMHCGIPVLVTAAGAAPSMLRVEPVDLPYHARVGASGLLVWPGDASTPQGYLFGWSGQSETGVPALISRILGVREDGLVRGSESFLQSAISAMDYTLEPEPFAAFAGTLGSIVLEDVIEVRFGQSLEQSRLLHPEVFNEVREIDLLDPVSVDDFHYLLRTFNAVGLYHAQSSDPIWTRSLDSPRAVVVFHPDPQGPAQIAVSIGSEVLILDRANGETVMQWPLVANGGLESARLLPGGGEQLLLLSPNVSGLVAFDVTTEEVLWQVDALTLPGLLVHDLQNDGLDELLMIRELETLPPGLIHLIEWRDSGGNLLHQAETSYPFSVAAVHDFDGDGVPVVLAGSSGYTRQFSIDLQNETWLPRVLTRDFSGFAAATDSDGELLLSLMTGTSNGTSVDDVFVRQVNGDTGELRWFSELGSADPEIVEVTSLVLDGPAGPLDRTYALTRIGNVANGGRVTEFDSSTGSLLRTTDFSSALGSDTVYRMFGFQDDSGVGLGLVSWDQAGTRYHLIDPEAPGPLAIRWSSPRLPLGAFAGPYRLDVVGQNLLILNQGAAGLVLDIETGLVLLDFGQTIRSAAFVRGPGESLWVASQANDNRLELTDLSTGNLVSSVQLDIEAYSIAPARNGVLLAERDRIHYFDFESEALVCSSALMSGFTGFVKGFIQDPSRDDRWLIGNASGIHGVSLSSPRPIFSDRFEFLDDASRPCPWQH
ncbi:hypothetical protein [Wenzhouxiangella marina]|uniref:Uncharacterized protein n=2 Tax=Wenzhouxiangella marina TaxID=1579979 RepID=A0A0K0XTX6_9GAMM|nr:hypothetical protein [Wenzhouxiangella marina]AKS41076.1 hypothetical protein WM2015_695 [Wenzhouxiangella marina]MBB6087954.1 hypothetical protein [Wenzhouxiangella marina]